MSVACAADAARLSAPAPSLVRRLAPFCVFFTACYGALVAGGPMVGAALYVTAAAWALRGPFAIVQALTVSWLVTMMNPGLMEPVPNGDVLKLLVVGAGFAMTLIYVVERRVRDVKSLGLLTLFCTTVAGGRQCCSAWAFWSQGLPSSPHGRWRPSSCSRAVRTDMTASEPRSSIRAA